MAEENNLDGEEAEPEPEQEQGEEEGEEEDYEDSSVFDGVSKLRLPKNMKHLVKDRPSESESQSKKSKEDQMKKTGGSFYKPDLSIKSPSAQVAKGGPSEAAVARADVKRRTTTGDGAESLATVTKSEMKKMTIRPFPKGLFVKKQGPATVEPDTKDKGPAVAKVPAPPKEDSFFKNLDVSKLDFSKFSERSSKKVDLSEGESKILQEVDKPKAVGKFKRRDNLEISPVMSEDEDAQKDKSVLSMKTSTLLKELSRNEKKQYIVPFNWGESGEVEIRSMR